MCLCELCVRMSVCKCLCVCGAVYVCGACVCVCRPLCVCVCVRVCVALRVCDAAMHCGCRVDRGHARNCGARLVMDWACLMMTHARRCDSGPGALFARHVPKAYQPMLFFLLHLLMSLSGFTLAVFAWHSQTIHTALLVLSLGMCVINGLKHYRHAYAHKQD